MSAAPSDGVQVQGFPVPFSGALPCGCCAPSNGAHPSSGCAPSGGVAHDALAVSDRGWNCYDADTCKAEVVVFLQFIF